MHLAAQGNHAKTLAALVRGGGDVNMTDAKGNTPLLIAALTGSNEAVTVLLNAGANVNATDSLGRTALDVSRARGHQAVTSQIMSRIVKSEGWTSSSNAPAGDAGLAPQSGSGSLPSL